MITLGIETSCDETSVSLVKDSYRVLANEVASSVSFHSRYGGVIPEIASRMHLETINEITLSVFKKAGILFKDVSLIAVTKSPGLIGSLLVGLSFAKGLATSCNKPLIGIDHVKAHLYPAFFQREKPRFPFIGLVISGGHTSLFLVKDFYNFTLIGKTKDDACGEAFDKVAKLLGLKYPGGPEIERLAKTGNADKIKFSFPGIKEGFDFSFSGIKTAVYYLTRNKKLTNVFKKDICASFQKAVTGLLIDKSIAVIEKYKIRDFVIGGGVSFNNYIRSCFRKRFKDMDIKLFVTDKQYCLDNAAMIAGLGSQLYRKKTLRKRFLIR